MSSLVICLLFITPSGALLPLHENKKRDTEKNKVIYLCIL
ncbi:hypothetical protein MuYL_2151 [Mucilaginibacter xinganensis]|uniref:Uncharacterized protein n=1 Tax=Mucilaginibacter xinganensis TaxID=1234841 RepID=A0A223NWW0_9SPHI|nr:hypothetical protein MuYL_2151 [Mucilaginibacter xinganensis]